MKKTVYPIIFILLASFIYAHGDLEDFPKIFIEGNELNAYIVVGDRASSSDVIAQSNLVLLFGRETNAPAGKKAKLASEITNIKQNLILVGNPCVNPLTARILENPLPCDKEFESGKALIKLIHKEDYDYLIIAGYSDKGTREAMNVLTSYKNYDLDDDEFIVDVKDDVPPKPVENKTEAKNDSKNITDDLEEELEIEDELLDDLDEIEIEDGVGENKTEEPAMESKKEGNILKKVWNWFASIFG